MRQTGRRLVTVCLLLMVGRVPLLAQTVKTRDASGREISRRCQPASSPKDLPLLSTLIDSTAAARELAQLPVPSERRWLLSVTFPRDAATPTIRWLEPDAGPDTVIRIVGAAAVARQGRGPWAVRLRVQPGSSPGLAVEPALYCPPHPSTSGPERIPVSVETARIQPGDRLPNPGRIQLLAEIDVLETGLAGNIRLLLGSGIRELDENFIGHWRRTRFLPALLEGMPVPGRYRTDGSSPRP